MITAIVTPLKGEFSVIIHELEKLRFTKRNLGLSKLEAFEFNDLDLIVVYGGHGKAQFGIQVQYLLCQIPQIELLVGAGVAGALSNSLSIGDIVVATEIVEHDFNLKFANRPLPRFTSDNQTIDNLKRLLKTNLGFAIHFGAVASGDEDIITETRKQEVAQLTGCIAVAWEGAGGARACKFSGKRYIELRAISDTANDSAIVDFEMNLAISMTNLAQLIIQWQTKIGEAKYST
jgi:adenosylhomocysteine nucleosidase